MDPLALQAWPTNYNTTLSHSCSLIRNTRLVHELPDTPDAPDKGPNQKYYLNHHHQFQQVHRDIDIYR
jgi:hypothetical protein